MIELSKLTSEPCQLVRLFLIFILPPFFKPITGAAAMKVIWLFFISEVYMDWINAAKELQSKGIAIREIARRLEKPYSTVHDNLNRSKLNKVTYEDKKSFTDEDIDKYLDIVKEMQRAAEVLDTKQVKAHITINDDRPIGIAHWGDWHIGAKGVDYERFESDEEKIQNTDGLYWIGMGDYKDNYQTFGHPGAQYEQILQPGMQDMSVKRTMHKNAYNCVALVRGCHDDWDKKVGDRDFIETMCKTMADERGDKGPLNLWHGGDLYVKFGNCDYHFKVRHKYKFESSLNPENSMRRIMEMQGPCDVACSAHLHNPYIMERHLMGEYRIMARSGAYKIWDEFGQKLAGYKGKPGIPVMILFPDKKKIIPMMMDEAIDVLKSLRK